MADETSWFSHYHDDRPREVGEYVPYAELSDEGSQEDTVVSVESFLPDELLERIIAYLPIASIIRAQSVCKRWNGIVSSKKYVSTTSPLPPQKSWYFMFTSCTEPIGYAYDPVLRKWYGIELPCIQTSDWCISSSCGLVCFMDNDSRSELYVCNPLTKIYKKIEEPPGLRFSDCYSTLAFWAKRNLKIYTITVVKSKEVVGDFIQSEVSVHIYDSESAMWISPVTEILTGWRGGEDSVICDGVLYFLIHSTRGGAPANRHGVLSYNLSARSSHGQLIRSFIHVPCALTCGRLMNLREKVVMVGGIGKPDRPDIVTGIGIWILNGRAWQEIARMPHKYFQGFGELDDVFASSGVNDLIYIQSYGAPALLLFDMRLRHWRWSQKCPVTKRFPLQLFNGFAFEPRLEVGYMDVVTDEPSPDDFKANNSNRIKYSRPDYRNQPYFTTDFEWKDYCPAVFRRILEIDCIDYSDYQLSVCGDETLKDIIFSMKPGMVFLLAKDNRFVIKAMRKSEVKVLLEMLPNYYHYVMKFGSSVIVKLYGVHCVRPAGGLKVYFSVWENIVPSDILIFEHYDLKGSVKGRGGSKVMVHERPVHKDMDFDFCFYVDPITRAQLLAQIKYDCEFLEAEGIMDYSLFLSIQIESPHEVDEKISIKHEKASRERSSRAVDKELLERISRLTDKEIFDGASEGSKSSESTLADLCDLLDRPGYKFGTSLPARAVRNFNKKEPMGSSRSNSRNSRYRAQSSKHECFNVILFFRIIDICQCYNIKKRLEHACKSIRYASKSIASVNPKVYSSRFQEFMSQVFLPEESNDFNSSRVSAGPSSNNSIR